MPFFATVTQRRLVAGFAALFFALLTLIAAAPHDHKCAPEGQTSACSLTSARADCPLCSWLAQPRAALPSLHLTLILAAFVPLSFVSLPEALCFASLPRRRSRAPPLWTL